MAITGHVFPEYMTGVAAGNLNMSGGTWKVALGNAAGPIGLATSGISTAKLFTDWTAIVAEVSGTGYVAGGTTVSSPTWTIGGTNNSVMTFTTATNPNWATATGFSINQAVLYQSSASTIQLAAFWDFGGSTAVVAPLTLTVNASGLLTATVS